MRSLNIYIVVAGIITVAMFATAVEMTRVGSEVPDWLVVAISMAVAFFFGAKASEANGK